MYSCEHHAWQRDVLVWLSWSSCRSEAQLSDFSLHPRVVDCNERFTHLCMCTVHYWHCSGLLPCATRLGRYLVTVLVACRTCSSTPGTQPSSNLTSHCHKCLRLSLSTAFSLLGRRALRSCSDWHGCSVVSPKCAAMHTCLRAASVNPSSVQTTHAMTLHIRKQRSSTP